MIIVEITKSTGNFKGFRGGHLLLSHEHLYCRSVYNITGLKYGLHVVYWLLDHDLDFIQIVMTINLKIP